MREIEYLKEQKRQLEEQLDFVHDNCATYEYVRHREDELMGQIAQIEEALENLEGVRKTSKLIGRMMAVIILTLAGLLLWAYFVKIT